VIAEAFSIVMVISFLIGFPIIIILSLKQLDRMMIEDGLSEWEE